MQRLAIFFVGTFFTVVLPLKAWGSDIPTECGDRLTWVDWFDSPEEKKALLIEQAVSRVELDDDWAVAFQDVLSLHWQRLLRRQRSLVTLAVGNRATHVPLYLRSDYEKLIRDLVAAGHTILYDADSLDAQWVRDLCGDDRGIGISAQTHSPENAILRVRNPYIRLKIFEGANSTIVTPRSSLGTALFMDGAARYAFFPQVKWKLPPKKKDEKKDEKKEKNRPELLLPQLTSWIWHIPDGLTKGRAPSAHLPAWDVKSLLEALDVVEIVELFSHADLQVQVTNRLAAVAGPRRASFLGWSIDHEEFRKVVDAGVGYVARQGYSMTTGGSGGYMARANKVAQENHAVSIGIPFVGLSRLTNEQEVYSHLHDHTLATRSYEVRIEALVSQMDIYLFGPGSSGTMRELAAAILESETRFEENLPYLFLDKGFYQEGIDWLRSVMLPVYLARQFHVVDSDLEMEPILSPPLRP